MRVLLFTYDFPPFRGGISTYSRLLGVELDRAGLDVHVLCPDGVGAAGIPGLTLHRFEAGSNGVSRLLLGRRALNRCVREVRPDLVHALSSMAHLAAGRFASLPIPLVVTVHGTELFRHLVQVRGVRRLSRKLFLAAYANAAQIICVSQFTRSLAETGGLSPDKLRVIYNGVETAVRPTPPEDKSAIRSRFDFFGRKVIVTIAQVRPRKGQREVIESMPQVLGTVPGAVYLIIGSGPSVEELKLKVRALRVEHAVRFCGATDDPTPFLAVADCFVQFSQVEGQFIESFGLSVAEAMAAGVPVVVSDLHALPEIVEANVSGRVVSRNRIDQLAAAIMGILTDPREAERLRSNALARVASAYSVDRMARETSDLYKSVPGARA